MSNDASSVRVSLQLEINNLASQVQKAKAYLKELENTGGPNASFLKEALQVEIAQSQQEIVELRKELSQVGKVAKVSGAELRRAFKLKGVGAMGIDQSLPKVTAEFKTFGKVLKGVDSELNQVAKEGMGRFKMEYLGLMFGGMQLKRVFGGMFKSMIAQYKEFTKDAATPLSNSLTRLEANWKFLKFAIVEAASPFLMILVDFVSAFVRAIAKMDPRALTIGLGAIAGLALTGGILEMLGQGVLFFSSIAMIKNTAALTSALSATGSLDTAKLTAGEKFFSAMGTASKIGLAIGISKTLYDLSSNSAVSFDKVLTDALIVGGSTGLLVGTAAGVLAGGVAGVVAAGVVLLVMKLSSDSKKAVSKDVDDAMKSFRVKQFDIGDLMSGTGLQDVVHKQSQLKADSTWWNPFDNAGTYVEELTTSYYKIMSQFRQGIITNSETQAQLQGLFPIVPSIEDMAEFTAAINTASTAITPVVDDFKTNIPAAINNLTTGGTGLPKVQLGLNNLNSSANNLNNALSQSVNKTVTITYKEVNKPASVSSARNYSSVNGNIPG
jgi:hypothetical protein